MSLMLPKTPPLRDDAHLKRVSEMACLVTNRPGPSDPHHLRMGWYAKGLKPPDDWVVPLSHEKHDELHRIGEATFWLRYLERDKTLLAEVLRGYAMNLRRVR